jgi:TolA-binding protein
MKRRSMPKIAPNDLRDHADEARVARVWDRLEQELAGAREAPEPRRAGIAALLLAATMAAFGVGLVSGKVMWGDPSRSTTPAIASSDDATFIDVLAAGSQERTVPLPGGGNLTLAPETTVEVERASDGSLTLRLVRGEASIDTARLAQPPDLSIVAGEARLSASTGSVVHVRRNQDDMDVSVSDGSVRLTSPAGSQQIGRGQRVQAVPIRTDVSTAPTGMVRPRLPAPARPSIDDDPNAPPATDAVVTTAPDWRARVKEVDYAGALELLRQQPGGLSGAIAAAKSATELMQITDVARTGGERSAAISALTRVVDSFPSDPNAQVAAYLLGKMYQEAGQTQLAQTYFDKSRSLSPEGALAEGALCKKIQAEHRASHKDEAIRLGKEYLGKYPNGPCKEIVETILAGGDPAAEEETPASEGDSDAGAAEPSPKP